MKIKMNTYTGTAVEEKSGLFSAPDVGRKEKPRRIYKLLFDMESQGQSDSYTGYVFAKNENHAMIKFSYLFDNLYRNGFSRFTVNDIHELSARRASLLKETKSGKLRTMRKNGIFERSKERVIITTIPHPIKYRHDDMPDV